MTAIMIPEVTGENKKKGYNNVLLHKIYIYSKYNYGVAKRIDTK